MVARVLFVTALVGSSLGALDARAQDIWATPAASANTQAVPPKTSPAVGTPRATVVAPVVSASNETPAVPAPTASAPAVEARGATREQNQVTTNGSYGERVLAGLRQIVLRDFEGAIETLRAAAQLEPASPAAFCHLGDAQLGKGEWAEASAAYETCARFAALSKDERYATLSLVGAARAGELRDASLAERRDLYVRLDTGTKNPQAKALAQARIDVFDGLKPLDDDYSGVRARIAERAAKPK